MSSAVTSIWMTPDRSLRPLKEGSSIDHVVLLPLYQVATTVKDFNVGEANKLLHIKITGYIKAVSTVLPRLKPTSSIVLFGGLAKDRPYPTSTMVTVANAGIVGVMKTSRGRTRSHSRQFSFARAGRRFAEMGCYRQEGRKSDR